MADKVDVKITTIPETNPKALEQFDN